MAGWKGMVVQMKLVILESPYAGDISANEEYARLCVRDSLSRGEAPIASHLLYTQPTILNDDDPIDRQWGIDAGLAWKAVAHGSVVYVDKGITKGMEYGIAAAKAAGIPVEMRRLSDQLYSATLRNNIAHANTFKHVRQIAQEARQACFVQFPDDFTMRSNNRHHVAPLFNAETFFVKWVSEWWEFLSHQNHSVNRET